MKFLKNSGFCQQFFAVWDFLGFLANWAFSRGFLIPTYFLKSSKNPSFLMLCWRLIIESWCTEISRSWVRIPKKISCKYVYFFFNFPGPLQRIQPKKKSLHRPRPKKLQFFSTQKKTRPNNLHVWVWSIITKK